MADPDTLPQPMTDADVAPPPVATGFEPAAPLKGATFEAVDGAPEGRVVQATGVVKDGAARLGQQATDKARLLAEDGKARAGSALDQLSTMLSDAAGQVDEKLGVQYGDYARQAAGSVQGFADSVRAKDIDELIGDVGDFVRRSPGVAVGIAAALGFAAARLVHSGIDQRS